MKANYKLNEGDQIDVEVPDPEPLDIAAENIPLDILYEDEDILIVNKPKGMVVHPSPGHHGSYAGQCDPVSLRRTFVRD